MKYLFFNLILALSITGSAAEINFNANAAYEVPQKFGDFGQARFFAMPLASVKQVQGLTTIKYVVPTELTGAVNSVQFTGRFTNGQSKMNSEYENMNCIKNVGELTCNVAFKKLTFDQASADFQLKSKFTGVELRQRQQIQRGFSTDPVGIIHIKF
ncbi:MAG: hypothetical protein H7061_06420 [Bdellovibrionaceae bacterium]|nr:hypothetical protein [Bdellovibrio sp.]